MKESCFWLFLTVISRDLRFEKMMKNLNKSRKIQNVKNRLLEKKGFLKNFLVFSFTFEWRSRQKSHFLKKWLILIKKVLKGLNLINNLDLVPVLKSAPELS